MRSFSGKTRRTTDDGLPTTPILGAKFWQPGISVSGVFVRSWISGNGPVNEFLANPEFSAYVTADGKIAEEPSALAEGEVAKPDRPTKVTVERFGIGNLAGFKMAMDEL